MTNAGTCVNCGRGQMEAPLISVAFKGENFSICPQCLPVLIHKPAQLAGKLAGVEGLTPADHEHH